MAYAFNGSTQNLEIGSSVVTQYPFTLACIGLANSFTSVPNCLGFDNSATNQGSVYLYFGSNGAVRCGIENGVSAGVYATSSTTSGTGTYVSMAAVYTSSTITVYNNGGGKVSASHSLTFPSVNRIRIAAARYSGTTGSYLNGNVAECALWNVALTDAEIASLAAGFTADQIRPQSLQFYAPLVRDLIDVRGGRAFTNNNSATVATHPRIIT